MTKTLKEYLAESKKVYSFHIKIAGDVPKDFEKDLKARLERCNVISFEKMKTTPIQKKIIDFPTIVNAEVTIFAVVLEYPITAPEISSDIKEIGIPEDYFKVRGSTEPEEVDERSAPSHEGEALLLDPDYKEATDVPQSELAGEEFNKSFLQDLAKAAKERDKELNDGNKDPDVLGSHDKGTLDKAGTKSAIGSK